MPPVNRTAAKTALQFNSIITTSTIAENESVRQHV
jgi:hypothetical protein